MGKKEEVMNKNGAERSWTRRREFEKEGLSLEERGAGVRKRFGAWECGNVGAWRQVWT